MNNKLIRILIVVLCGVGLSACQTVPYRGGQGCADVSNEDGCDNPVPINNSGQQIAAIGEMLVGTAIPIIQTIAEAKYGYGGYYGGGYGYYNHREHYGQRGYFSRNYGHYGNQKMNHGYRVPYKSGYEPRGSHQSQNIRPSGYRKGSSGHHNGGSSGCGSSNGGSHQGQNGHSSGRRNDSPGSNCGNSSSGHGSSNNNGGSHGGSSGRGSSSKSSSCEDGGTWR